MKTDLTEFYCRVLFKNKSCRLGGAANTTETRICIALRQSRTRKRSKCQWSERQLGTDTSLVFWTRATVSSYHMQRKSLVCESACEAGGDWGGADWRSGRMCAALLLRIL